MQTNALYLLVAAGLAFAGPALAQSNTTTRPGDSLVITRDGNDVNIARTEPMERIDVTAPALRDGSHVAVTGTVSGVEGRNLLISSAHNGQVLARIQETGSPEVTFYAKPIAGQVAVGDSVTVFGALKKRGEGLMVQADAVYDGASGTLYFPRESDQLEASSFYNPTGYVFDGHAMNRRYRVL